MLTQLSQATAFAWAHSLCAVRMHYVPAAYEIDWIVTGTTVAGRLRFEVTAASSASAHRTSPTAFTVIESVCATPLTPTLVAAVELVRIVKLFDVPADMVYPFRLNVMLVFVAFATAKYESALAGS